MNERLEAARAWTDALDQFREISNEDLPEYDPTDAAANDHNERLIDAADRLIEAQDALSRIAGK